ncbi:daughters against dpp isoform 1-T4 [Cochliomyia hominivorax]
MKFQSEKKELWRYASKNLTTPVRGTTRPQPLPHRLQHQRHPQSSEYAMMMTNSFQPTSLGCCDDYGESSVSSKTTMSLLRQENISTPPPPYSSVPELDCSSNSAILDYRRTFHHQQTYPTDGATETSVSVTDSDAGYGQKQTPNKDGCKCVNSGDIMFAEDYGKLNDSSTSSSYKLTTELQKKVRHLSPQPKIPTNPQIVAATTTTSTSSTTSFAATAAKILRNCCGGTFGSSNSATTVASNRNVVNNNNTTTTAISNTCNIQKHEHSKSTLNYTTNSCSNNNNYSNEQYFDTLMKQLKGNQISLLLKAVKSRHDQIIPILPANSNNSSISLSQRCSVATYQTNCILIRQADILGEEPYVTTCRLFLWRDLKSASQLKRLPVCPNKRDTVSVCCNPLHWCRILETETIPPPYTDQRMNQIEGENSQNGINSPYFGSTDPENIRKNYGVLEKHVAESVTTDGEDRRCSPNWCEVAYWELAQRVGERFPADRPTINIFSDKSYTTSGEHYDDMCLKELIEKRTTPSPDDVQYTRQKIGLGVTLSQESDGVWLYNRSSVPVFVYSPTLTESWNRVCRVEPGDCLRAFDEYMAHSIVLPGHFLCKQTGPIDRFSMRISFGKGWGYFYKRPDITLCPCWLEVLFKPQR